MPTDSSNRSATDALPDEHVTETTDFEDPETFLPQFSLQLGHVRVTDEETNDTRYLWKAKLQPTDDPVDIESVSGTPFDAAMGALEEYVERSDTEGL